MRKVALVFVLAVFVPSLVLAWLAVRSLRDQQFALERQQWLLYQGVADSVAKEAASLLGEHQREFARQVEALLADHEPLEVASSFDRLLRKNWPLAQVGFTVSLDGQVFSPNLFDSPEANRFRRENEKFLCNRETVEVYWPGPKAAANISQADEKEASAAQAQAAEAAPDAGSYSKITKDSKQTRNVAPQQKAQPELDNVSKVA